MRIIISPAKQMVVCENPLDALTQPALIEQSQLVLAYLQSLSYSEAKELWGCSDKLATKVYEQLCGASLDDASTPALLAYDGIAFKYMAPAVFEDGHFDYAQQHLRILSALYGALRPLDAVILYRLEMQAKAHVDGARDLYAFWDSCLYEAVMDGNADRVIVNLASKEYSQCISRYLQPQDTMITCVFGELEGEKVKQKGVYAKMARGDMVRFMAERGIEDPREMREYDRLGYAYCPERSSETEYVFLKD